MCDKAILENGGTLKFVTDCCKNQEMCNKAVDDDCPHALEFVPECFMTQKICDKAVNTYLSTIKSVSECFMTQKLCNKAVKDVFCGFFLFLIDIKLNKYVTELLLKIFFQ